MPGPSIPSLMPLWVRHFPVLLALGSLPFTWLVAVVAIRLSGSREPVPEGPWYARARALWPQQAVTRQTQLVLPIVLLVLAPLARGPVTATPAWVVALLLYPGALLGAALATRSFLVSQGVRRSVGAQVRGALSWLLVNALAVWLAVIGAHVPRALEGAPRMVAIGLFLAATAAASAGAGVYLARAVGLVAEAGPALAAAAKAAAEASGHRPRFVWEIDLAQANALALPWMQGVLVSRRLLEIASPEELEAVLRHELGHLREPKVVQVGRLALPWVGTWTVILIPVFLQGALGLLGLLAWVLALLVAAILLRRVSRRMEHRADEALGEDHAAYARALEKLYAENLVPAVIGEKRLTHPELYDRMSAAGHPPSWPRPEPPRKARAGRLVVVLALLAPVEVAVAPLVFQRPALEVRSEWDVVLDGGAGGALFGVARGWLKRDRREEAKALVLALAGEDQSELASFSAAGILAEGGFCREANRLAAERGLLGTGSRWTRWLQARLEDCEDGQAFVRESEE